MHQTANSNTLVTITSPTNGAGFAAPTNVQIDAVAVDLSNRVASVVFVASPGGPGVVPPFAIYLGAASNGVPIGPDGSHQELFTFTWSNALPGTWAITAQVVTSNGFEFGSPPVTIAIRSCYVLSEDTATPTNGATFNAPANIQLIAGASESGGGTVRSVQFFDGLHSLRGWSAATWW